VTILYTVQSIGRKCISTVSFTLHIERNFKLISHILFDCFMTPECEGKKCAGATDLSNYGTRRQPMAYDEVCAHKSYILILFYL